MDQIQNALKTVTDRMSQKSQQKDEFIIDDNDTVKNSQGTKYTKSTSQKQDKMKERMKEKEKENTDFRRKDK